MYFLSLLHQTTTLRGEAIITCGLYFLSLLHQTTTRSLSRCRSLTLYFLSLLHQTTTANPPHPIRSGCISFLFYIKPQPHEQFVLIIRCCISFLFYIKPQLDTISNDGEKCCISFLFYIKPQLFKLATKQKDVVFPFSSTSNHNVRFLSS